MSIIQRTALWQSPARSYGPKLCDVLAEMMTDAGELAKIRIDAIEKSLVFWVPIDEISEVYHGDDHD
jgi:hypothetical protein